ncbi:hypothetical protein [Clostridium sp. DL1XJH146]
MKDIKEKNSTKTILNSNTPYILDRKYFNNTYDSLNNLKSTHIPNENIFK